MISTVTVQRLTTAEVAIEHPDGWSDEQLQAAATNRANDIANRADTWCGDTKVTLTQIARDHDYREAEDDEEATDAPKPYRPDPVELSEDDLVTPAPPVVVSADAAMADEVADG